ncbi:MAG: restriction endonuclease subunit S [Planctomycetota bacterium]|jgi:type I restriction enzyme S subunit
MITDLKPYPAMKDSGVEWLGEVPEHWEVRQLGRIGSFLKGKGGTKEDEVENGVPCVRYGDLYTQHRFFIQKTRSCVSLEKSESYTPIHYGDVLFAGSGETIEEIGKSAVSLIPEPACCGGDVIIFRPSIAVDAKFFGYATDDPKAAYQKSCMGRGITIMHIYGGQLKYMSVSLPPLPEQVAIVRYLDHMDRRVRQYVRAKQKLIALLEEQKQAIIHRAVTRGLDPNVPLKPSGVEWLGEVPEHWDVRRNGWLFAQRNETGYAELPILEVSLKTGVRVRDFENTGRKQVMSDRDKYKRAVQGDLAYNMMRMWQGAVGVAPVDGLISPAYVVARPLPGTEVRYFEKLFRTAVYMQEVDNYSRGIVKDRNRLYWEDFKAMPTCYPPPEEQVRIADAIDKATAANDTAITRANCEIELLNEYRTRLISDVVTGKLDMREAAANLPDEPDELEPIDNGDDPMDKGEAMVEDLDAAPEET